MSSVCRVLAAGFCVLQAILQDAEDPTQVRLLYANKTPDDILLKEELDKMSQDSGGRFKVRASWQLVAASHASIAC